jgi:osmoprotectant transport system permease protein
MFNIPLLTLQHLELSAAGVALAMAIGIPLGYLITRNKILARTVLAFIDITQTIPALALLALLLLWMGLGNGPLIAALVIYSLLPIVRNTYTGLNSVDASLIEAGKGMGMTRWQLLRMVQIPIALPVIMAGIRVAMVTAIGIAAIGVLIGAGGLGAPIWRGMQQMDNGMILSGAIPAALLAIITETVMERVEQGLTPRGLRKVVTGN